MSKIVVHAGDFRIGSSGYWTVLTPNSIYLHKTGQSQFEHPELIPISAFMEAVIATEASQTKIITTLGLAAGGALLIGPFGLLAGFLGGKQKQVTFMGVIAGGRKMLATVDHKLYQKIAVAALA